MNLAPLLTEPVGWAVGGGLLVLAHLAAHPLSRYFRDSLRWLSRHPLIVLVSASSMAVQHWHKPWVEQAPADLSYLHWRLLLQDCLARGVKSFAWLYHDVMHHGALYQLAPLLLCIALVFRFKCFRQEQTPLLHRCRSLAVFAVLITGATGLSLNTFGLLQWPASWIYWGTLGEQAITIAMVQIYCNRLLVDTKIVDHPALPALAESSRRWSAILALAVLEAIALALDQDRAPSTQLIRQLVLPEFLLATSLLPMFIAGTKYPFLQAGGLSVRMMAKLSLPLLSLLVSGVILMSWLEYVLVQASALPPSSTVTILCALVRAIMQCWLFVTCGLLLLRSGYLQPEEPPHEEECPAAPQ